MPVPKISFSEPLPLHVPNPVHLLVYVPSLFCAPSTRQPPFAVIIEVPSVLSTTAFQPSLWFPLMAVAGCTIVLISLMAVMANITFKIPIMAFVRVTAAFSSPLGNFLVRFVA